MKDQNLKEINDKKNEIIENNQIIKESEKEEKPKNTKIILQIMENLPKSDEFYAKIEKDQKGKLNPRIPGIFILFDNIDFYFSNFFKYDFFENYQTFIFNEHPGKEEIFLKMKEYLQEYTNIPTILESNNISFDDIISDYFLYFISKSEKLQKDSYDIKYIFKIISNLFNIFKDANKIDSYDYFIQVIMFFNCMKSYITYPLNAIKFLHDEKIIKAIYTKIIKEISLFEKEKNILFILIESFFNLLINEILSNNEIISKLNYIHIFLMNIINIMQIESKSFYVYMQFKSLYKLIKEEKNNKLLNNIYSEIFKLKSIFSSSIKKEETLEAYIQFYEKLRNDYKISNYNALRIFIVDFFTYELKKYQNDQELFPIILDVLSENNGDAFLSSKKIFNIFLEKYVFKEPPETKQECREILARTFKFELEEEEINDPKENEKIKDIDKEENKEKEEQNKKEVEKEQKDPINDDIMKEIELIEPEEIKEEEQKIMPEIKDN